MPTAPSSRLSWRRLALEALRYSLEPEDGQSRLAKNQPAVGFAFGGKLIAGEVQRRPISFTASDWRKIGAPHHAARTERRVGILEQRWDRLDEWEPTGHGHGAFAELAQTGYFDEGVREARQAKDRAAAGLLRCVWVPSADRTEVLDHNAQAG